MRTELTPKAVATAELIDACTDLAGDLRNFRIDVRRASAAAVHLLGEAALAAGLRGRVVRFVCGQPLRETCRLGVFVDVAWRRTVAMEQGR